MSKTISETLAAAGWTKTDAAALGTVRTFSSSRELMLTPRVASIGQPIALSAVLPAGARVAIGEESGIVEYHSRGAGYVRISADVQHEAPISILRDLIEADARIDA